jgi:hypothetical protein
VTQSERVRTGKAADPTTVSTALSVGSRPVSVDGVIDFRGYRLRTNRDTGSQLDSSQ